MPVIVSLLRGINLGSHKRMKMDALRSVFCSIGIQEPQTYLQSGNVIFHLGTDDTAGLAKRIETAIEAAFGFQSDVILRTAAELRHATEQNPFASRHPLDPSKLLVTFLARQPTTESRNALLERRFDAEEVRLVGGNLFIYFPNGVGKSKLQASWLENTLQTTGTARNWNTVTNLARMAEQLESMRIPGGSAVP